MKRLTVLVPALAIAFAQNPAPQSGQPASSPPSTVIRIDVNLVQVDAVVTDSRGRHVTGLQPADFELWQDGKPQAITNLAYVSNKPAAPAAPVRAAAPAKPVKGEAPPPPAVLQPSEVRRALALIVDDLGLSADSIPPVRSAIRNFIDQQMRPGDLVAVIRTGAGMGALQQFTTDKRLLYAALARVKYGESRVGIGSFAPLGSGMRGDEAVNHLREEILAMGSLGAIRFVVNAMAGFPGRKSAVLFTENIRMIYHRTTDDMVDHAVEQLSDAASRAAVVIHTVDPRGIQSYQVEAEDNTAGMRSRRISRVPAQREMETMHTQEGASAVADTSGGLFLHDNNDLAGALRMAAEDSDGYYLIGYRPDASTFETKSGQPEFHALDVKVKKPGLHVRSRDGFFGQPGGGNLAVEHTRAAELTQALQSPYSASALHPRLTAVFSNLRQTGSYINAWLSYNANELKWSSEPDGSHKALLDVAAAVFDENGEALAPVDTTFNLHLTARQYDDALKKGMVYGIHVPVKKPGPYLVRAALRDPATESSGSAQQFVEVPDIESGHLALSGIVLHEESAAPATAEPPQTPAPGEDVTGGAARRRFRRGAPLDYGYEILNAQASGGQRPELEVQTRLFHDGEQVLAGQATPVAAEGVTDPQHLNAGGRLTLGRDIPTGAYTLQVIVTDKLARSKFQTVAQSMDFEIEP
jgi:VWFA-related protein